MQTDLSSVIKCKASIDPAAIYNSNGTKTGAIIDSKGYSSLVFTLQSGALTDGTWTHQVFGSNASDMTGEVELTGTDLCGTNPALAITEDSACEQVGVNIAKVGYRYYRQKATQASATTGGFVCGTAILGNPRFAPVSANGSA